MTNKIILKTEEQISDSIAKELHGTIALSEYSEFPEGTVGKTGFESHKRTILDFIIAQRADDMTKISEKVMQQRGKWESLAARKAMDNIAEFIKENK